jgi:hypothetical protein
MKKSSSNKEKEEFDRLTPEEKCKKLLEDVPKLFKEIRDSNGVLKKKQETLNKMFEALSHACNNNPKNG